MQVVESFKLKDFTMMKQIGSGKSGIVYYGKQIQSRRDVAIKIIAKRKIQSESMYIQIKRQIQIQSHLKHENICQLYAYFTDQNNIYLVMEYCERGSLFCPIKIQRERFSDKTIASIFHQLVKAIAYMQQRNIMHRDIKLENILLDKNYNIKLTDFGWAVHTLKDRTTFCGTMEYICPQMLKNQSYGHEVDVYCLGIILYQLYFVNSPFIQDNQRDTLLNIKQGVFVFDDTVRQIPVSAKQLICLLLSPERTKRPKAKQILKSQFILQFL